MNASKGEGDVERDGPACKYKWNTLLSDFKKIWDYHSRTGRNSEEYFTDTSPEEKKQYKLPKAFYISAYRNMSEWLRDKATLTPPHARDTMDPDDRNYSASIPEEASQGRGFLDRLGEEGWPGVQGPQPAPIDLSASDSPQMSTGYSHRNIGSPGLGAGLGSTPLHTASFADLGRLRSNLPSQGFRSEEINLNNPPQVGVTPPRGGQSPVTQQPPRSGQVPVRSSPPAGTMPPASRQGRPIEEVHVLSSTATSAAAQLRKTIGSTGHKKRRSSEVSGIAEGVSKSAEKMVRVLGEINETQKETEKEKLQVHTKLFEQGLEYKRERDRLNLENTRIAQEHQKMTLMNQQMVVQAIANLASALARTLPPSANTRQPGGTTANTIPNNDPDDAMPHVPAQDD
ncbi:hypothetical protein M758_2G222900 [Ceratodon purpureus]|nr:hypothetical protein M758_2G222900 [Ceratodon purpureus]